MTLIIEDGSVVPNADSFVSVEDARAIAAELGISLPDDELKAESALRNGAIYIVTQIESSVTGLRVSPVQRLTFPRSGAISEYGFELANDEVPREAINSQIMAAVDIGKGVDPRKIDNGLRVAGEKIDGAVERTYFDSGKTGGSGGSIVLTKAVDALRPYMRPASLNFRVTR